MSPSRISQQLLVLVMTFYSKNAMDFSVLFVYKLNVDETRQNSNTSIEYAYLDMKQNDGRTYGPISCRIKEDAEYNIDF